jgi:hypothetical protein
MPQPNSRWTENLPKSVTWKRLYALRQLSTPSELRLRGALNWVSNVSFSLSHASRTEAIYRRNRSSWSGLSEYRSTSPILFCSSIFPYTKYWRHVLTSRKPISFWASPRAFAMPYGFVGFMVGRGDYSVSATTDATCTNPTPPPSTAECGGFPITSSASRSNAFLCGGSVGAGLDWAITPNLFCAKSSNTSCSRHWPTSTFRSSTPGSAPASSSKPFWPGAALSEARVNATGTTAMAKARRRIGPR